MFAQDCIYVIFETYKTTFDWKIQNKMLLSNIPSQDSKL